MKLLEFITGSKKICHVCHESFYVEPLACPKCGTKVKTHKSEKWGAAIGAFAGFIVWQSEMWSAMKAYDKMSIVEKTQTDEILKRAFKKSNGEDFGLTEILYGAEFGFELDLLSKVIVGALVGFIITLVIKKIVLAVRAKKARQEG